MDPCTFGRFPLDDNIKDPRDWFLLVFGCRLHQIKGEWRQVVWKVVKSVHDYEKAHRCLLAPPGKNRSSREARLRNEEILQSVQWVVAARNLSTRLSRCLTRTVQACERFCSTSAAYFDDVPGALHIASSFCAIQTSFDDLKSLMNTLEDATHFCDCFVQNASYLPLFRLSEFQGSPLTLYLCSLNFNSASAKASSQSRTMA